MPKLRPFDFLYLGCALLLIVGSILLFLKPGAQVQSQGDDAPPLPVWYPLTAKEEIAASEGVTNETIAALDCSDQSMNSTVRSLCLVQAVQRTWPFTDPQCGLRNHTYKGENERPNPDPDLPRILNTTMSTTAGIGEYPWFILILSIPDRWYDRIKEPVEWSVHCGGSLITWKRGLTAAHCCTKIHNRGLHKYRLHFGYYTTWEKDHLQKVSKDQLRNPTDCFKHPDWISSHNHTGQDIAILKWDQPVAMKYSAGLGLIIVNTICLPPEPFNRTQIYGVWQEAVGNGRLDPGLEADFPEKLQRVPLWISDKNTEVCFERFYYADQHFHFTDHFYYLHCPVKPRNMGTI